MTARVWYFRCSLSVDTLAAAWLVSRFGGEGVEACFVRHAPPEDAEGERVCFDQDGAREACAATRFEAAMGKLGLDDPALRKLAAVVRDADHRGESPSPLAIALTALVQGWDLMPAPPQGDPAEARARQTLRYAAPVFDSLHAHFANLFQGPSH